MEDISINDLKDKKESFIDEIRWDVTPKVFMRQGQYSGKKADSGPDNIDGYMLYIDFVDDKPAVFIMKNHYSQSKTVGYIKDIPETLLQDALKLKQGESVAGMYPLSEELEAWLKKELNVS
ncbi:MAG: hypothetical protein Q7U10_03500 [Thermodesulfovibrionia bacterium]|nr:hypothetical protein [Thermodesulfovibrionia bacterium]